MEKIKIVDKEFKVVKEYDQAVCIWETISSNVDTYETIEIKKDEKVYNVKVLETGSIIFKIENDDNSRFVASFAEMFGFPSEEQLNEIKKLEKKSI